MNVLILEDTRQQEFKHKMKHDYFRSVGVSWNRTALYCGDYTLPANQSVCVDTKKDIQELIGDIQVKSTPKSTIKEMVFDICKDNHIGFDLGEIIFHAICDDDVDRFAEKEINDICFKNGISERAVGEFQKLYVKRHGFFHRGLKRAQNSGVKLYVLVENKDGVRSVEDVFKWRNPRLNYTIADRSMITGYCKNGNPRYAKKQKYPHAVNGEQLAKSLLTMQERYSCEFRFTTPEESGKTILELLKVEV